MIAASLQRAARLGVRPQASCKLHAPSFVRRRSPTANQLDVSRGCFAAALIFVRRGVSRDTQLLCEQQHRATEVSAMRGGSGSEV